MTATTLSLSLMAPVTAHASTLISIGATGSWTNTPVTGLQRWPVTNNFADDPVTATEVVEYPASLGFVGMSMEDSVLEGAAALLQAIGSISGRKIVACESQGCLSVTQLLMQFAADPGIAPARDDLIIVMIGNPATAGTGASSQNAGEYEPFFRITFPGATPETQYETVNVTREYDFFADRPSTDPSVLAVLNNLVAFLVVHPFYADVDMDDPDNLIKVVGNTTYVLIPTKQLPMLQSLYDAARAWQRLTGQTDLLEDVEALDARLRAIIDRDYDRSGYVPQGSPQEPEDADAPEAEDQTTATSEDAVPAQTIEDQSRQVDSESANSPEPEQNTIDTEDVDAESAEDETLADAEAETKDEAQVEELTEAEAEDDAADLANDKDEPDDSEPAGTPAPSGSAPETNSTSDSAGAESGSGGAASI
ncbi:PE-PPE domain-containing protein [Mycobacterium sp. AMU20-3851]|uniref:PE-PPE domain-containing protein n=1 Tax=Mycobacterium sp. AMU20-3851 TaxID=3122055 RepID=UPI0037546E58